MDFFSGNYFSLAGRSPQCLETVHHTPLYYGIQYNHCGGVYVKIGDNPRYEEHGPCVFITYPGVMFEYGPVDNQPRDHHFICFYGPRIQQYINTGLLPLGPGNPIIKVLHPEQFHHTVIEIIDLVDSQETALNRTTLKLEDLLLQLHEQNTGPRQLPPYQLPAFSELFTRITEHPEFDWDFQREAKRINVTPTHFRRLFKRCCNLSPQQYVIHHRLRMAAHLLVTTSLQVGTISEQSGFNSEFYFSRLFKKKYYLSPLQYRRELSAHPAS